MFWPHPKKTFHNLLPPTLPSDRPVPAGSREWCVVGAVQDGRGGKEEGRKSQEKITTCETEVWGYDFSLQARLSCFSKCGLY